MVRLQIHLRPDTHFALVQRARAEGVSAAELVRQGIEMRLALEQGGEFPPAEAAARRAAGGWGGISVPLRLLLPLLLEWRASHDDR